MEQTELNLRNEAIARFMGYEFVTVGYFGTPSETKWQKENENWQYKVGLDDIGDYWVNIKEDKFINADDEGLNYDSSWNSLMPVLIKIINQRSSYCIFTGIGHSGPSFYFDMLNDEKIGYQGKSEEGNEIQAVFIAISDFCISQNNNRSYIKNLV